MRIYPLLVINLAVFVASAALYDPGYKLAARAQLFTIEEGGGRPEPPRIGPSPPRIPPPPNGGRFTLLFLRELVRIRPKNYGVKRMPVSIFPPEDKTITSIWTNDRYQEEEGRIVHAYYGRDLQNIANMRIAENGGEAVYEYRPVDPPKQRSTRVQSQRRSGAFKKWVDKAKGIIEDKKRTAVNRYSLDMQVDGISPYEALTEADMMRLIRMMTGTGDTVYLHYAPESEPALRGEILYRPSQKYVSPVPVDAAEEAPTDRRARLITFADELPRRKGKRNDIITTITTDVGSTNTSDDASAEFSLIWDAFQTVQSNISDTIFPFLDTMVNNTNSSLLYEAAWSIWVDLTASNEYTAGPFKNGMHSLDAIEDAYLKANNVTEDDPAFQNMLVVDAILLDAYTTTWNQAFAAVNGTGLLGQLQILAGYLLANNTSVPPALFYDANQAHYDDNYFLESNHNTTIIVQ